MTALSELYGAVTTLRNTLFNRGLLTSRRLQKPVVSIGNLSAGGSGKTPFVIALGELLKARGLPFDVLSRGYGRKTRGVLVVDPDGTAVEFGDEPLLIARRLAAPVIVGESRYRAGVIAEHKFRSQLHLLDDGFQHRSLARDFDIVLMTESDFQDRLLPAGRLREPLSSLRRADAIVLPESASGSEKWSAETAKFPYREKIVWRMSRQISVPTSIVAPIVFCGIARPQQFFTQVRAAGIIAAAEIEFRDHHPYNAGDIRRLTALRSKLGAGGFLTTEKDAINLGPLGPELQQTLEPLSIATLKLKIENPNELLDTILARLHNRKPGS